MTRWTLVRHSGAGYGGDRSFVRALEEAAVTTRRQEALVRRAGGLLLDTYAEARAVAVAAGLAAPGGFSSERIRGLSVYRPAGAAARGAPTPAVRVRRDGSL